MTPISRRNFLAAGAALTAVLSQTGADEVPAAPPPPVCGFSKHMQFITDFKELGRAAKEIGLDGLDLTVRKGGHVSPESVKRDLPRAVEAIRGEGVEVAMITTNLLSGADPDAVPILESASELGIKYARIGNHSYSDDGNIMDELDKFTEESQSLSDVLKHSNMTGGYHNHSGGTNVGACIWDLYRMIETVQSPNFGSNFDVGHATVEGGSGSWRLNTRLMAPHVKMMSVKDFVWDGRKVRWLPFGKGNVQTVEILKILRAAGFAGPISIHVEYEVTSNAAMLEEIRSTAVTLRDNIMEAGYA